ncbi:MAG: transporter [Cytophagaceae bacterium]
MNIFKRISLLFAALLISVLSWCQTEMSPETCGEFCCCVVDPSPAGVMISHVHPPKEIMISYRFMSMEMADIISGSRTVNSNEIFQKQYLMAPEGMRMDMHMLMLMYGLSRKLTLMGMLHYNINRMQMGMPDNNSHQHHSLGTENEKMAMHSSGFGDLKFSVLYSLLNKTRDKIVASVGLSLPTGNIGLMGSEANMYQNQRLPYNMQLGSGTFDIQPGITYGYTKNDFTFSAQALYTIRTGMSTYGYRHGNEMLVNTWAAYFWHENFSSSLRAEAVSIGKMKGSDPILYPLMEPSANALNYGANRLMLHLGTSVHFKTGVLKNSKIGVEYGLPIYQYVTGYQMRFKSNINAQLSIVF